MKKVKVLVYFFLVPVAMVCATGGSDTMKDKSGNTYKTVKIGNQVWMAENLNYETSSGSSCYDDDPANCEKYGRLYDWETAMTVCPEGWRLPTKRDFETLLNNFVVDGAEAYNAIKDGGNSGFSAFLGGWCDNGGRFHRIENIGNWWSSSDDGIYIAWNLHIRSSDKHINMSGSSKEWGLSVRCLKD
jgi:uncharacterized protein (TIGR02145 family)